VGLDPFEDFAVAFSGSQLVQKGFEIEAEEAHEVLVGGRVIVVFAVSPGQLCATLSKIRGRRTKPPRRERMLRGGCWVKSVCAIGALLIA
jgi:hypothetical protein